MIAIVYTWGFCINGYKRGWCVEDEVAWVAYIVFVLFIKCLGCILTYARGLYKKENITVVQFIKLKILEKVDNVENTRKLMRELKLLNRIEE